MNWKALKNFKCPSCNGDLQHIVPRGIECKTCPFLIGHDKFQSIIASLYTPKKFRTEEENLSDLNNLGRKEIGEDFGNSEFLNY